MKKTELSVTIPPTEPPAETKSWMATLEERFQSTSTLRQMPTLRASSHVVAPLRQIHTPKGAFNKGKAYKYNTSPKDNVTFSGRSTTFFAPVILDDCPLLPMANAQHDPVIAQLERQKLTASLVPLIVSIFTQPLSPSSSFPA
jgi:hypothetical protein